MSRSMAWILEFGEELAAAVGSGELVQVVSDPELFAVPQTPPHCRQAMIWQGRALPVLDVGRWLTGREVSRDRLFAGIVAHASRKKKDKSAEFAALLLSAIPVRRAVDDEDACPLPPEPVTWQEVSWACFGKGERSYPVLALSRMFSGALQ